MCCPVWPLNPVCGLRSYRAPEGVGSIVQMSLEMDSCVDWGNPSSLFWHSLVYGRNSSVIFLWNHSVVSCGSCFFFFCPRFRSQGCFVLMLCSPYSFPSCGKSTSLWRAPETVHSNSFCLILVLYLTLLKEWVLLQIQLDKNKLHFVFT